MADQRSRGGKKKGQDNPQAPEQHQGTTAARSEPDRKSHRDADEGQQQPGRPTYEDQNEKK